MSASTRSGLLAVAALALGGLTACSGSGDDAADSGTSSTQAPSSPADSPTEESPSPTGTGEESPSEPGTSPSPGKGTITIPSIEQPSGDSSPMSATPPAS